MPNIAIFLNKEEIAKFDKLCQQKGCNRYQLSKMAIQRLLEMEEIKDERGEIRGESPKIIDVNSGSDKTKRRIF